jgi:hypothetical protein
MNVAIDQPKVSKRDVAAAKAQFPRLPTTVMFLLYDMVAFSSDDDARERVQQLSGYEDENIPRLFFNENYFTTEEARCLVRLKMTKNSPCKTFGAAFGAFLDERFRNNDAQVCTKSEVAPFLCKTLRIDPDFSRDKEFKREYQAFKKEWKKARKQQRRRRKH